MLFLLIPPLTPPDILPFPQLHHFPHSRPPPIVICQADPLPSPPYRIFLLLFHLPSSSPSTLSSPFRYLPFSSLPSLLFVHFLFLLFPLLFLLLLTFILHFLSPTSFFRSPNVPMFSLSQSLDGGSVHMPNENAYVTSGQKKRTGDVSRLHLLYKQCLQTRCVAIFI